jgi:hypothetical protein
MSISLRRVLKSIGLVSSASAPSSKAFRFIPHPHAGQAGGSLGGAVEGPAQAARIDLIGQSDAEKRGHPNGLRQRGRTVRERLPPARN